MRIVQNQAERDCTYIDMVSCGNSIVQNFLFGRNEEIEHMCPPSCETDSFFVDSVMVSSLTSELDKKCSIQYYIL